MTRALKLTRKRIPRRGSAMVEFAVVSPVLLMLLVGSIEVGRGINVKNRCAEAARAGARVFSMRKDKNEADVRAMVDQIMSESGLSDYTIELAPDPASKIKQLDPVSVTISVEATDASWYPTPWFIPAGSMITSSCTMPADLGESSADDNSADELDETGELIDDDAVAELSGDKSPEVQQLEQQVLELLEEAEELRELSDKLQQQAEADMMQAKLDRDRDAYNAAQELQNDADAANKQATEAEQRAREALAKLTQMSAP